MKFNNTYAKLDEAFYERTRPAPVRNPQLFLWNAVLAEQLHIPEELQDDSEVLARIFSGNRILPGSDPIATAYAGHQFGSFVPRLGDGRAHLLGEVMDLNGKGWDIQLKGSGQNSFSRAGDGRCPLGPAVREFIMSEAMEALGIPSTRCLAVVTTGEPVYRERPLPGAVVTRVASSHLRIGTFQYFAARNDLKSLRTLSDYAIERHYPELMEEDRNRYSLLIKRVIEKQIHTVVEWMRVGFIHGVMNTDNTAISGETIDYGPCAMMGIYDPGTVYSSIDTMGRYAFGNQPSILHWNIARFAECLLPLIDADNTKALEQVRPLVSEFPSRFYDVFVKVMGRKLGLTSIGPDDHQLIDAVLSRLKEKRMDYTLTFDLLTKSLMSREITSHLKSELGQWFERWQKRLNRQQALISDVQELMRQNNPVVIPRNHHIEKIIGECERSGNGVSAENFLKVLRSPYQERAQTHIYQDPPVDGDKNYATFCGT